MRIRYMLSHQLNTFAGKRLLNPKSPLRLPVVRHMLHNDMEVRCEVTTDGNNLITVDVPLASFNSLAVMDTSAK
jgi:hypothetical protein